jgi:hypothetical protein
MPQLRWTLNWDGIEFRRPITSEELPPRHDTQWEAIGFSFNIAHRASIHRRGVEWYDLEADVWVDAGRSAVLDEDAVPTTTANVGRPHSHLLVARPSCAAS